MIFDVGWLPGGSSLSRENQRIRSFITAVLVCGRSQHRTVTVHNAVYC